MSAHACARVFVALLIGGVMLTATTQAQTTWYVDDDSPPGGDGLTWPTAFTFLQDALAVAQPGDEIRVAGGEYPPDRDAINPAGTGNRNAVFELVDGVALRGGYAGWADPNDPNHRDITIYESVLTGDLNGDDEPEFTNRGDNAYTVARARDGAIVVLDGLTLSGANDDTTIGDDGGALIIKDQAGVAATDCRFADSATVGYGGGVFCSWASFSANRCSFIGNRVDSDGGAVSLSSLSTGLLHDCYFADNYADREGGAVRSWTADLIIEGCVFETNTSDLSGGAFNGVGDLSTCAFADNEAHANGGAVQAAGGTILEDCLFIDNVAYGAGGGVRASGDTVEIIRCDFVENIAGANGGGVSSSAALTVMGECLLEGNFTSGVGGGARCWDAVLSGCIFEDNWANDRGGGLSVGTEWTDSSVTITDSEFRRNTGDHGGGLACQECTATVRDCEFAENRWQGGGIWATEADMTIVGCTFQHNLLSVASGGGIYVFDTRSQIANCAFFGNSAEYNFGGGAYLEGGVATVSGCAFVGNHTFAHVAGGSAIFAYETEVVLTNSSIAFNPVGAGGPAIELISSAAPILIGNCVFWENDYSLFATAPELTVSYCSFQEAHAGQGNIVSDPLFVRNPSPGVDGWWGTADDDFGNLRLLPGSPCIDAGCNWAVPFDVADLDDDGDTTEATPLDLDGEGRFFDDPNTPDTGCGFPPIVDMGAYEFGDTGPQPCFADFDGDRDVDLSDLAALLSNYGDVDTCDGDLDCDGDVDLNDLSALLAVYGTTCE